LERTFQILVFVFGSTFHGRICTFHGRISTFFKVLRDLTKTKGEEDPKKNGVFRSKVSKTQHQNPEFGPKPGEIQKKKDLANKYISIQGMHHFISFWW